MTLATIAALSKKEKHVPLFRNHKSDIILNDGQQHAFDEFKKWLEESVSNRFILNGQAGTGKTTMIEHVVNYLDDMDYSFRLTAMTHKSSFVLHTKTKRESITLHSCLGLLPHLNEMDGTETYEENGEAKYDDDDIIIVDEAIMINHNLWEIILNSIDNHHLRYILVADPFQLLPVKENECKAIQNDGVDTQTKLTKVERHDSKILNFVTDLCSIVKHEKPFFNLITYHNPKEGINIVENEEFRSALFQHMKQAYQNNSKETDICKYIAWTNNNVLRMSKRIHTIALEREASIPNDGDLMIFNESVVKGFGRDAKIIFTYIEGYHCNINTAGKQETIFVPLHITDKKNLLDLYARRARRVAKIWKESKTKGHADAKRQAWKDFFRQKEEIVDLRFPYACTVHKSQGSTYKHVFVDLNDISKCTDNNLVARLMYVAASRASDSVWITGDWPNYVKK